MHEHEVFGRIFPSAFFNKQNTNEDTLFAETKANKTVFEKSVNPKRIRPTFSFPVYKDIAI